MPAPGTFVLHSMANPPLKAGDYTLTGRVNVQKADGSSVGEVDPQTSHVRITSPRYRLPPEQMLSTFPPANAVGAFSERLPQIVIKRRTLPWEREPAPGASDTPWLALVVLAEGEATLSGEVPVQQCVTPGVTLTGPSDVASSVYLSVTRSVIDKVFPRKEELPLLAHVREVDVSDTELAMGDDDGFLACLIANRLPQYDREGDKPVRYMACLVNVEGQLESLAKPQPAVFQFDALLKTFDYRTLVAEGSGGSDGDRMVMGVSPAAAAHAQAGALAARSRAAPLAAAAVSTTSGTARAAVAAGAAGASKGSSASWATTTAKVEKAGLTSTAHEAGHLVRDAMKEGWRGNLEQLGLLDPVLRFPVLASWSFTVGGAGSFEGLMRNLDVGMIGTEPLGRWPSPGEPPAPPAPPKPPLPRAAPEFTETGHIGLPHLTRGGDRVRAWFRGPLAPFLTTRDAPDAEGRLPLAHVSDQLRRVVPDGREDLSLAAAFEIGRLLALSQPSLVRALLAWRAEQFGAARARQMLDVLRDTPALRAVMAGATGSLSELLSRHVVRSAAKRPAQVLAPTRPVADPGRPLPYAKEGGLDRIIAQGFGFTTAQVQEFRAGAGSALSLQRVAVQQLKKGVQGPLLEGAAVERLRGALQADVGRLATDAFGQRIDVVGGPRGKPARAGGAPAIDTPRAPDALDDLIARASRQKGGPR
jgi:hypothetical protein